MPVYYRLRGTDLTKRPEIVIARDHLHETFRYLAKMGTWHGWKKSHQRWAKAVLIDAGYDIRKLESAINRAKCHAAADSDLDFAARILECIVKINAAIENGHAERAAMEGIRLGETIAYLQITERRNRRTNKGGRPPKNGRNTLMRDEFLRRQSAGSKLGPAALKAKIGADRKFMMSIDSEPLGKSASIAAIDAALKTVR
jgi:hypothetical protein